MKLATNSGTGKKAYCLFDNINISDSNKLQEYKEKVFPVVSAFGGKYIVASDNIRVVEGSWSPRYLVMIEFPDFEKASNWYDSEEYKELKNLRQSAGVFDGIIFGDL
jgi:uncharacterized protein (DUF1330 family)